MTEVSPAPDPEHRRSADAAGQLSRARRFRRLLFLLPPAVIAAMLALGEAATRIGGGRPVPGLVAAEGRGWAYAPGTMPTGESTASIGPSGTRGAQGEPGGILLLGDEVAFGAGLADAETVAAALRAAGTGPVTLAACERYGTAQQLAWGRELAPALAPRAVVFLFSFDDTHPFASTLFTTLAVRLRARSALAARVLRPASPQDARLQELFDPEGIPWRLWATGTVPAVRAWKREAGVRVLVAPWPPMRRGSEAMAEYFQQVRGEVLLAGLEFVDLRGAIGDDPAALALPSGLPNAEAHRRVAAALAAALQE